MILKYSNFVYRAKYICIISVIALACLLVLIPFIDEGSQHTNFQLTNAVTADRQDTIKSPQLQGVSQHKDIYKINAQSITQTGPDFIFSSKITAEMLYFDGTILSMKADLAHINKKENIILLEDNVWLTHKDCQLHTTKAEIRIDQQVVEGKNPVQANCSEGKINANGFNYNQQTRKLLFHGPVNLKIN